MSDMHFKGKGVYDAESLKNPGDFGYRIDNINGTEQIQLAMHCPKFGVCMIKIHLAAPAHPIWNWNGNWEKPTIHP
jgi:hypothetical protein